MYISVQSITSSPTPTSVCTCTCRSDCVVVPLTGCRHSDCPTDVPIQEKKRRLRAETVGDFNFPLQVSRGDQWYCAVLLIHAVIEKNCHGVSEVCPEAHSVPLVTHPWFREELALRHRNRNPLIIIIILRIIIIRMPIILQDCHDQLDIKEYSFKCKHPSRISFPLEHRTRAGQEGCPI